MKMPSIGVSDEVKKKLNIIKNIDGYKSVNEILEQFIILYEKSKFLRASQMFRDALKKKNVKFSDFMDQDEIKVIYPGE